MKHYITDQVAKNLLQVFIGKHVDVFAKKSTDDRISEVIITESGRGVCVFSEEKSNTGNDYFHAILMIEDNAQTTDTDLLVTQGICCEITGMNSPLSEEIVAALEIEFEKGRIFICGADMPYSLAVDLNNQSFATMEYTRENYSPIFRLG